jgi:hypothetical protein
MGKFTQVTNDVFSIFGTSKWLAENIKTFPVNFTITNVPNNEYIRVAVLSSGRQAANPLKSISGQVLIEIFTSAGYGPDRSNLIADKLDNYLVGKAFKSESGLTQFKESSLGMEAVDSANSSLSRVLYSISFNYFGV